MDDKWLKRGVYLGVAGTIVAFVVLYAYQAHYRKEALLQYNRGEAFFAESNYDEAIRAYRKAIDFEPKFPGGLTSSQFCAVTYNNIGLALYFQGNYEEAIRNYEKAMELDPKRIAAYRWSTTPNSNYVVALGALGDLHNINEAIRSYRKAIEIDPKDAAAHDALVLALRRGKAVIAPHAYRPYPWEVGGGVYIDQTKLDEAIFRKVIEINSKDAMAYKGLALAFDAQGKTKEAAEARTRAHELQAAK